jgi:hypothetical protein
MFTVFGALLSITVKAQLTLFGNLPNTLRINPLKPNDNYIYQPFNCQLLYMLYLKVLHDSQCEQRLFP